MKALVTSADAPGGLVLSDVPDPQPSDDDVLVSVDAVSINRGELRLIGVRPNGWQPGQDVAGRVIAAAADGSGPAVGTRVVASVDQAGWAEQVVVATNRLAELPDDVDAATAATLPIAGLTALRLVELKGSLLARRVLLTGASGGVGRFVVELAALAGAEVTGTAGSAQRAEGLAELGIHRVIADAEEADGRFDVVLESIGGASFGAAMRHLAPDGLMTVFGNARGAASTFDRNDLVDAPRATIRSFRLHDSGPASGYGADLRRLVGLVATDRLHPVVAIRSSLDDPIPALEALRERRVNGKAVLELS